MFRLLLNKNKKEEALQSSSRSAKHFLIFVSIGIRVCMCEQFITCLFSLDVRLILPHAQVWIHSSHAANTHIHTHNTLSNTYLHRNQSLHHISVLVYGKSKPALEKSSKQKTNFRIDTFEWVEINEECFCCSCVSFQSRCWAEGEIYHYFSPAPPLPHSSLPWRIVLHLHTHQSCCCWLRRFSMISTLWALYLHSFINVMRCISELNLSLIFHLCFTICQILRDVKNDCYYRHNSCIRQTSNCCLL